MKKTLIFLFVIAVTGMAGGQADYIPEPYMVYASVSGVPTVATTTATTGQLNFVPTAILAKCWNASLQKPADCVFSGGSAGVSSFNTRTGAVTPQSGDYTASQVGADPSGAASGLLATANTFTQTQTIKSVITTASPGYQEVLYTPATSAATCTAGQFADDASFHYVCVATNTWKRVALSAF